MQYAACVLVRSDLPPEIPKAVAAGQIESAIWREAEHFLLPLAVIDPSPELRVYSTRCFYSCLGQPVV